jgi:hypothetical protein
LTLAADAVRGGFTDMRLTIFAIALCGYTALCPTALGSAESQQGGLPALQREVALLKSQVATLQTQLASLQGLATLQAQVTAIQGVLACMSKVGDEVVFEGCNVHIRSGTGSTDGIVNGLGNLVVGYNEGDVALDRSGSHNLVVGRSHTYSSFGGFVAGEGNTVAARAASVCGGIGNTASGLGSSVSGGQSNAATAPGSAVSGGLSNTASNFFASVSGGAHNVATELESTVSGGTNRTATTLGGWAAGSLSEPN